jgi:hypothetical protein
MENNVSQYLEGQVFVPPWLSITAEVVLDFSKSLDLPENALQFCVLVTLDCRHRSELKTGTLNYKATSDIAIVIYRQMMDPGVIGREASRHILIESFISRNCHSSDCV